MLGNFSSVIRGIYDKEATNRGIQFSYLDSNSTIFIKSKIKNLKDNGILPGNITPESLCINWGVNATIEPNSIMTISSPLVKNGTYTYIQLINGPLLLGEGKQGGHLGILTQLLNPSTAVTTTDRETVKPLLCLACEIAGELEIYEGKIKWWDCSSGTFKPPTEICKVFDSPFLPKELFQEEIYSTSTPPSSPRPITPPFYLNIPATHTSYNDLTGRTDVELDSSRSNGMLVVK
jgi:hypothetical protein